MTTTAQSWFDRLLSTLGHFLATLFHKAKPIWDSLSEQQQDETIKGVNISQIIKTGYDKGEQWVIDEISKETGVAPDVAETAIIQVGKDCFNIDFAKAQDVLDKFADKIQAGVTDKKWNAIWEDVAKFAVSFISDGRVSWETLGLGIIQIALQLFVKPKQN